MEVLLIAYVRWGARRNGKRQWKLQSFWLLERWHFVKYPDQRHWSQETKGHSQLFLWLRWFSWESKWIGMTKAARWKDQMGRSYPSTWMEDVLWWKDGKAWIWWRKWSSSTAKSLGLEMWLQQEDWMLQGVGAQRNKLDRLWRLQLCFHRCRHILQQRSQETKWWTWKKFH